MSTEAEREAYKRVEHRLDEAITLIGDIRERLAHMEGRQTDSAVEKLRADLAAIQTRVTSLEAANNILSGQLQASKTWGEWLHRLAPWIFMVGLATWTYFKPPV